MDVTGDELAGVVDLFGALTRAELREALAELAFKAGEDHDHAAFEGDVEDACRSYHLVAVDADAVAEPVETDADGDVIVPGPIAFPTLPEGATDLPHILDVEERTVDRDVAGRAAEARFRADAASAIEAGDHDRIAELLDVSYELEVWGPVDLASARSRLDDAVEE